MSTFKEEKQNFEEVNAKEKQEKDNTEIVAENLENASTLSKKELKKQIRAEKKAQKQKRRNDKHLERFGISYDEVEDKIPANARKKELKDNPEKIKKSKTNYKMFLKYFTKHKFLVSLLIILSVFQIACSFASLPFTQYTIDLVVAGEWTQAMLYCLLILGFWILYYIFGALYFIAFGTINSRAIAELRRELAIKALNTESKKYKTLSSGEIVYRVSSEPNDFGNTLVTIFNSIFYALVSVGYIVYFAFTNYILGLCMVVILCVSFVLFKIFLKQRKIQQRRSKLLNEKMNSFTTEFVRGSDDVKSLNLKNIVLGRMQKWIDFRKNNNMYNTTYTNTMVSVRCMAEEILIILSLILAIYLVGINMISFGAFVVFMQYRSTPKQLTNYLSNILTGIQDSKISCDRMGKLYDEEIYTQEKFGNFDLVDYQGSITFKNVSFSYDEQKVLDNISFKLPAKHSLGIVGKSGEGKSTILGLIERLNDCDSGEILLDDINNKDLTEQSLRGSVSLVPQSPYIFNTTIRENLLYAKPDATEEEMIEVLKKAQFYDFIVSKPEGLDTIVGEGGVVLSGGQRQRLAIARAFLTDCKVLMLDEATSALDNKNQEGIKSVIDEMKNTCSFIIVAHRLSTIVDCDEIIVIDEHKIVARGKHEELLESCKIYSDLYKLEKQQS